MSPLTVVNRDLALLHRWYDKMTVTAIRRLESFWPNCLHNGRPVRGIDLGNNVVLCRDRQFYAIFKLDGQLHLEPLTMAAVLERVPLTTLMAKWRRINAQRERLRDQRYGRR